MLLRALVQGQFVKPFFSATGQGGQQDTQGFTEVPHQKEEHNQESSNG